ncbi:MAG: hypothetical protein HZA54_08190 [Planctomycetes bacterium]|nr:hypothetical protein [Planctomycetota bacterium]
MNTVYEFERLTLFEILGAGLLDGINPCALTTLVFLCSFLAYAGYARREVVVVGGLYSAGTFVAYFLLSLGTLQAVLVLSAYRTVNLLFSAAVIPLTFALALLSLRDAWILNRTGSGRDAALRLPDAVRARIHALIRERLRGGRLGAGAFLLGGFIALFEYLCSSQILVPTLAAVVKGRAGVERALQVRALACLLLYNLAFIAPMLGVFAATVAGVSSRRLSGVARAHVATVRLLLGILFLWFGVVLAVLFVKEWFP